MPTSIHRPLDEPGLPAADRLTRRQALFRGLGAGLGFYAAGALSFGRTPALAAGTAGASFGLGAYCITDADADALKNNISSRAPYTDMAVLHCWRTDAAFALKAANPNAKCFMYQTFGGVDAGSPPGNHPDANNACTVRYADALAHDGPDPNTRWLLKDGSGNLIQPGDWPWIAYTNPGAPGYASLAAWNVVSRLGKLGAPWDGVFIDDVNPAAYVDGSNWGVQNWQSTLMRGLRDFATPVRSNGFQVIANIGWVPGYANWSIWAMATCIDGVSCEHFNLDVPNALGPLCWAAENGKWFMATSYVNDPTYPLGGVMLGSRDRRQLCCVPAAPVHPLYDTAAKLGAANQSWGRWSSGTYGRPFQHGNVVVDPGRQAAAFVPTS